MNPPWTRTAFPFLAGLIITYLLTTFTSIDTELAKLTVFNITKAQAIAYASACIVAVLGYLYHALAVYLGKRWPSLEKWMLGSSLVPTYGLTRSHAKGLIPDSPDERDFERFFDKAVALPASVSLRGKFSGVYNQGRLGSCTANASAAVYDFVRKNILGKPFITPSRLFIYYFERLIEGTVSTDSGAMVRDSLKVLNKYGAPAESLWKYVVSKFTVKPSAAAIKAAALNEALVYARVQQTAPAMKQILASGLPILIGFTCYPGLESAETAKTGILPMPAPGEQSIGGHAVVIVGYNTISGAPYWEVRNSWGKAWGDHGYFWVPEEYFLHPALASDFWVLDKVS
jgi:C1A family cysteine protease